MKASSHRPGHLPEVLILSFSRIASDPRVMRQIRLLEPRCSVTVVGYGAKPDANVQFQGLALQRAGVPKKLFWAVKLLFGLFDSYYWSRPEVRSSDRMLKGRAFDLVIANDISALPLALRISAGRPVVIDAHEYSPLEFEDQWLWRLLFGRYQHHLCRSFLPSAAAMVTVCKGIADEYALRYGVAPEVVENAPNFHDLQPSRLEPGRIRLVHHGAAIRSRRLELMIDVIKNLDHRFTLDLMIAGNDATYLSELHKRAAGDPRIRFVPPVPLARICNALNSYDVGIYLLPPVNFNHRHALPNKFFEFVQARLGVAIGPSPEMARFVEDYGFGVVASSFEPTEFAAMLMRLTPSDVERYKRAADRAASSMNFERSEATLLRMIDRLLARDTASVAGAFT